MAQAELEDRERPGAYHRLRFRDPDGGPLDIDTTRPELLAACVALVAHPDDARFQKWFGQTATTPLFDQPVPIVAHPLADPEKGTGMAMVCTFGDVTDVIWWRELHLPVRAIIGRDGRITQAPPGLEGGPFEEIRGLKINAAQARMVELLRESGDLIGEPQPITHPVKFYERGDRPLEIVTSRQWFIRTLDHRDRAAGAGPGAALAPALHAGPLRVVGERAQQRLAHQPPALLRRPLPPLVPGPGRRDRRPPAPDRGRRGPPARRPVHRRARPATPPTSATSPAASPATPT